MKKVSYKPTKKNDGRHSKKAALARAERKSKKYNKYDW